MRYLRVSTIAESSGCIKFLRSKILTSYRNSGGGSNRTKQTDAQLVGTGVHELIQFVLTRKGSERGKVAEQISMDLEHLRQNLESSDLLRKAFPDGYFQTGVIQHRMIKTWEEAKTLLQGSMNLLKALEEWKKGSENKWSVKEEVTINTKNDHHGYDHSPPSSRNIAGEELNLHGSIDLVFEYQSYRILAELKTGGYSEKKRRNWERQVKVYVDVWKEKHKEHTVFGAIIQQHLTNGFRHLSGPINWASLADPSQAVGGPQCQQCKYRNSCDVSEFEGTQMLYMM